MNIGTQSRALTLAVYPPSAKYLFLIALALPGSFLLLPALGCWYSWRHKHRGSE